jgi:hypothetical protein
MYNPGMDSQPSPPAVRSFLPAALILMLLGWGGIAYLWTQTQPFLGPRWAFYFTSVLAFTGTALPIVAYLNRRFPSKPPPSNLVIVRQAIWVGIYFPTLLWLRIPRVVSLPLALLLAAGLILIEFLLRLRERSQWKPESHA